MREPLHPKPATLGELRDSGYVSRRTKAELRENLVERLRSDTIAFPGIVGFDETVLWVLPANARARRFYEIAGWACDGTERTMEVQGVVVPEVRYRRRSIREESSSATPVGTE